MTCSRSLLMILISLRLSLSLLLKILVRADPRNSRSSPLSTCTIDSSNATSSKTNKMRTVSLSLNLLCTLRLTHKVNKKTSPKKSRPSSKDTIRRLTNTMFFSCSRSTNTLREFKVAVKDWSSDKSCLIIISKRTIKIKFWRFVSNMAEMLTMQTMATYGFKHLHISESSKILMRLSSILKKLLTLLVKRKS